MRKIGLFSVLLLLGLAGSQLLPSLLGASHAAVAEVVTFLAMAGLSFIMIHVGYEFELETKRLRAYG